MAPKHDNQSKKRKSLSEGMQFVERRSKLKDDSLLTTSMQNVVKEKQSEKIESRYYVYPYKSYFSYCK